MKRDMASTWKADMEAHCDVGNVLVASVCYNSCTLFTAIYLE